MPAVQDKWNDKRKMKVQDASQSYWSIGVMEQWHMAPTAWDY
ncbi:MAG: hypothetical protein P8184_20470 [Calditrichia bacterium]